MPNIQAVVFGVYAEQDERINAGIEPLEQALADAGITYQITIYPGVNDASIPTPASAMLKSKQRKPGKRHGLVRRVCVRPTVAFLCNMITCEVDRYTSTRTGKQVEKDR